MRSFLVLFRKIVRTTRILFTILILKLSTNIHRLKKMRMGKADPSSYAQPGKLVRHCNIIKTDSPRENTANKISSIYRECNHTPY